MKSRIFFLIFIVFIVSCTNNNTTKTEAEDYEFDVLNDTGEKKYKKMLYKAIETGDTLLYTKAANWYTLSNKAENLIFFSNIMALKYNYSKAYRDIYFVYYSRYFFANQLVEESDTTLINFILFNLAKSHELGDKIQREYVGNDTITIENIKDS